MLYLIAVILTVLGFAGFDWWWIEVKKRYIPDHTFRWILRTAVIGAIGWNHLIETFAMGMFFAATFDNTLNVMRGKKLFFLGKTAHWDVFWQEVRCFKLMFSSKVLCYTLKPV